MARKPAGIVASTSSARASPPLIRTRGPTPRASSRVIGSVQLVSVSTSSSDRTSRPGRPVSKGVLPVFVEPASVVLMLTVSQPVGPSVRQTTGSSSSSGSGHGSQAPAVPPQVTVAVTSPRATSSSPEAESTPLFTAASSCCSRTAAVSASTFASSVRSLEVSPVRIAGTPAPASRSVPISGAETGVPSGPMLRGAAPSIADSRAAARPSRPSATYFTCIASGAGCGAPVPPEESVASASKRRVSPSPTTRAATAALPEDRPFVRVVCSSPVPSVAPT